MTTLYLKYRPQKINELDLTEIREKLSQILSSSKIGHAFLFSGPKGLGKTSAARLLAKSVNCLNKKEADFEPCNKCAICEAINKGICLDLIEIDAASNRGIDDIRSLREKIKLAPNTAKKKIYVIDEVHMLTTEAFNALLKTLEEPPSHAVFILCTTEIWKLPATIVSRCMTLNFSEPTEKEILRPLKRIIKKEQIKVEEGVLELISLHCDHSFRDAVKILEQLSYGRKKISLAEAKIAIEKNGGIRIDEFVRFLLEKKSDACLKELEKGVKQGMDIKWFTRQILEKLKDALVQNINNKKMKNNLLQLIEIIHQESKDISFSIISHLPMEIAIVKWSSIEDKDDVLDPEIKQTNTRNYQLHSVIEKWSEFLAILKKDYQSIEALLKSARPLKIENQQLFIEVFYPFHLKKLEETINKKIVEDKLGEFIKQLIKVKYILSKRKRGEK